MLSGEVPGDDAPVPPAPRQHRRCCPPTLTLPHQPRPPEVHHAGAGHWCWCRHSYKVSPHLPSSVQVVCSPVCIHFIPRGSALILAVLALPQ